MSKKNVPVQLSTFERFEALDASLVAGALWAILLPKDVTRYVNLDTRYCSCRRREDVACKHILTALRRRDAVLCKIGIRDAAAIPDSDRLQILSLRRSFKTALKCEEVQYV